MLLKLRLLFCIGLSLVLIGCATRLAPQYDQALFQGLIQVNQSVMSLFASMQAGSADSDFEARRDIYIDTIGLVDALIIQSRSRPVPDSHILQRVNQYLDSRGVASLSLSTIPTTDALEMISSQLKKMYQVDARQGLSPTEVALFRNAVVLSLDQAFTYESFLFR